MADPQPSNPTYGKPTPDQSTPPAPADGTVQDLPEQTLDQDAASQVKGGRFVIDGLDKSS